MLSLAMFIGMFTGSQLIGPISDSYGRRTGTVFAMTLTSVFGFLSVLSPSLGVLLVTRFCVGMGVACSPAAQVLLAEILPTRERLESSYHALTWDSCLLII